MVYKKAEIRKLVLKFVEELQRKIPVEKVILFGSYTYGRPTKTSDIDIDPIGFTEDELAKADYFEIGGEMVEKGVVVYEAA